MCILLYFCSSYGAAAYARDNTFGRILDGHQELPTSPKSIYAGNAQYLPVQSNQEVLCAVITEYFA